MQRLAVVEKDVNGKTRIQKLLPVRFGRLETIT
jgi:protein-L-isoaspartate(D-aspartate) O-methyltransferase